jgi:hypothetical protein
MQKSNARNMQFQKLAIPETSNSRN